MKWLIHQILLEHILWMKNLYDWLLYLYAIILTEKIFYFYTLTIFFVQNFFKLNLIFIIRIIILNKSKNLLLPYKYKYSKIYINIYIIYINLVKLILVNLFLMVLLTLPSFLHLNIFQYHQMN